MRVSRHLVAALVVAALSAVLLTGCSPDQQNAVDAAKQKVDEQTTQSQATVDEKLNAAQATVKELSSAAGDLEARINGLQLNAELQELQRKLTDAIGEAGDKKKAALDELSNSFNDLVSRVDTAAGKLPAGGPVRTKLEDFSAKLKDAQASVAQAAASMEASTTP